MDGLRARSPGAVRRWLAAACLPVMLLGTVAALLVFKGVGERAVAAERDLAAAEAALQRYDAAQWRALSGRYHPTAMGATLWQARGQVQSLLDIARREGVTAAERSRMDAAIGAYYAATDVELALISGGQLRKAQDYDDAVTAGSFRAMIRVIEATRLEVATNGARARWLSDAGVVVVALLSLGTVAAMERRRRGVERRRREETAYQATHDALTGLPNRALFFARLREAVARAGRNGTETSLLYVDIDDFKSINDTMGHRIGDDVLTLVAERMRSVLRGEQFVARLGGDEFAVLLVDVPPDEAMLVADRLVAAVAEDVAVDGHRLHLSASVGLAGLCDVDAATGAEIGLLAVADLALYAAKTEGKSRCLRYQAQMAERAGRRRAVESGLRAAVSGEAPGELYVAYQPVIRTADRAVTAVEALARWHSDGLGAVAPAEFIPAAEASGLIGELGRRVLWEAGRTVAGWNEANFDRPPLGLVVNVSARQLLDSDLVGDVRAMLAETGLPAGLLTLEVPEPQLASDECLPVLRELRGLGVRLGIDDFGTAWGSITRFDALPIDVLKIDGSIVRAIDREPARAHILAALLRLAADLGLEAVAEGVETEEQLAHLSALGCPYVQGFRLGGPLPAGAAQGALAGELALGVRS